MLLKIKRLIDILLFSSVGSVVAVGRRRTLSKDDLPLLPEVFAGDDDLRHAQKTPLNRGPWVFLWELLLAFRGSLLLTLGLNLLRMGAGLVAPLLMYRLIGALSAGVGTDGEMRAAVVSALGLCLSSVVVAMASQHYFYQALCLAMRIRAAVTRWIYEHALGFPRWRRVAYETGDLVNHIGVDAFAVSESPFIVSEILYSIIVTIGVAAMLFHFLGWAAVVPFMVLLVLIPVSHFVGKRFITIDSQLMTERDKRVSLMSQALSGIRVVKFFAWDRRVEREIGERRRTELGCLRRLVMAQSVSELFYYFTSTLLSFGSFAAYLVLGHELDAATVFACLALFAKLEEPFGQITHIVANLAQGRVSAHRLLNFLQEKSVAGDSECRLSPAGHAVGVSLQNVTLRHADSDDAVVRDLSFAVKPGEAVAIVGPVGSGKSSLLLSLLGEIPHVEGDISYEGLVDTEPRLAYVPQEAFIINGTLRDNISLGGEDGTLDAALFVSCFQEDLSLMPQGLDTEIGEHGVNLSGGQKQRVSLARAYMRDPGLILLDDPLSAVDFPTEDRLIDRLLFGAWREQTRVMVTHRLAHLEKFDRVVFLEGGRMVASGRYADLLLRVPRFAEFVRQSIGEVRQEPDHSTQLSAGELENQAKESAGEGHLTVAESREIGRVSWRHFWTYFRSMGGRNSRVAGLRLSGLILVLLLAVSLQVMQDSWLAAWTSWLDSRGDVLKLGVLVDRAIDFLGGAHARTWLAKILDSDSLSIGIYGALGAVFMVATFARFLAWGLSAIVAARDLHDQALSSVLSAPLRFFDSNPVGRILNRFSSDMGKLEGEVAWSFENTIFTTIRVVVSLTVMVVVFPPVALLVIALSFVLFRLQKSYRASAREAQRLHSMAFSPVLGYFKETLSGLTVVRAMRQEGRFSEEFLGRLRHQMRMFYAMVLLNRWFTIRIPLLTSLLMMFVSLGIAWLAAQGGIAAGLAGLVLTYSLHFWNSLTWSIRSFSVLESSMVSVERIRDYGTIPAEPVVSRTPQLPDDAAWPTVGRVEFDNVVVRYAEHLPDVLRGVTFTVNAGTRVGIVGRTGSGKSTLFQTLFRFIEARSGRILIDGVDIATIPLQRLRQSVAIIPQSPTLFVGTLRSNLDRFVQFSDSEIWEALERVYLADFVRSLNGNLEAEVRENGENFSLGQRQLFCLARALLVRARVLVLDEATASVDVETDALIQKTIRTAFVGVTMLIIAHRLDTVTDCDALVELQDGCVKDASASLSGDSGGDVDDFLLFETPNEGVALQMNQVHQSADAP